ncbi:MAG TPA: trimethylamine methyltransferase family protein [Myxococcota bacterium]
MKPTLQILDREAIQKIHDAALELLQDVGVKFGSEPAEALLLEAGQTLDSTTGAMRLSPELVEDCLAKLPSRIHLAGRDEKRDITLGTGRIHTCSDGMGTFILDPESGQRRPSTAADLIAATRLSDALESLDLYWPSIVPSDVPDSVRTITEAALGFMHTTLHNQHEIKLPEQVEPLLEMLDAILGDRRRHAERPIFSVTCCPVSPLQHEPEMTTACMELARNDIPISVLPMPLAGATAPVTIAGTVVMTYAEFLSGMTLYQLVRPGAPIILGIGASILDMHTGLYSAGAPELSLINIALTQIGKHIGVPVVAQGIVSDAKNPGTQAAMEKAVNGLSAFMAGADIVNGLGLLDSHQLMSFEQLVIDDEMAKMVKRVAEGFEVDRDHFMLDLIRDVGIGGHFLGQRRTLEYLQKGEHFQPKLSYRASYESWSTRRYDEVEWARERATRLLKEHEVAPLAPEVERAIREVIRRADPEVGFDLQGA